MNTKKIYFASDLHLGLYGHEKSLAREKKFVAWLDFIKPTASEIYLLGDVFDYWFEYKSVVPRGFVRMLGKLAELTDAGIIVHFFTGNHDVWTFDYLEKELGMIIHRNPIKIELQGKLFYLAHGDGLGGKNYSFKLLKGAFTNKFLQWFYTRLHPNFTFWLAHKWSHSSRDSKQVAEPFLGEEKEHLVGYAKELEALNHSDYYIFGHRHIPLNLPISENSNVVILGEWIQGATYASLEKGVINLHSWE